MAQLNIGDVPLDEKEKLKKYLLHHREGMSIREWILEKIEQDTKEDEPSKITDFHDRYVRSVPPFYAKRATWIGHLVFVVEDKEAIKEFESRMRMLAGDWNLIFGMKDNKERLKRFAENPASVKMGSAYG